MDIIELVIDENEEISGIDAVSVVESPAIEEDFIALKNQQAFALKEIDSEKRILMGAALVPDKPIYRKRGDHEFYIYFSKKTIRKAAELFLKRGNQGKATLEHKDEYLEGMSVVESWLVEDKDKDKSAKYGFNVPVGTWMISMKVDNDKIWTKVKAGEVKGFSIEGYFADKLADKPKTDLQKEDSEKYKIIDDRLAYSTKEKAEEIAEDLGCSGFHIHSVDGQDWYMPCEKHSLAEIGERGGVKKSPKAPKSATPNKNPKGKGTAKGDASGKTGAKVSAQDKATLTKKAKEFNERYKKKLGYGVSSSVLASVFQRGLGAFTKSHSPKVKSASQWAFARVNAFLYLIKNGRPQNPKYTTDYDLLPAKHPKKQKLSQELIEIIKNVLQN